jgi:hypothetical protein
MTKSKGIGRGGARKGSGRKPKYTDLQKFVALYKSFGIECIVNKEKDNNSFIAFVGANPNQDNCFDTVSSKFRSDCIRDPSMEDLAESLPAYSQIHFDADGKFILQEFLLP